MNGYPSKPNRRCNGEDQTSPDHTPYMGGCTNPGHSHACHTNNAWGICTRPLCASEELAHLSGTFCLAGGSLQAPTIVPLSGVFRVILFDGWDPLLPSGGRHVQRCIIKHMKPVMHTSMCGDAHHLAQRLARGVGMRRRPLRASNEGAEGA